MSLSKAELLTPRIEVVADYPNSPFAVGDILLFEKSDGVFTTYKKEGYKEGVITAMDFANYPHLFRQLPWYEKRELEDMPEYIKDIRLGKVIVKVHCYEIISGIMCFISEANKDTGYLSGLSIWTPATLEEYNQYINGKTK